MNVFSNVTLPFKFLLLGIVVCLSIVIPTKFFYETETSLVNTSKEELNGIVPSTRVILLIKKVQEYRGLTAIYLNQSNGDSNAISTKAAAVLADFDEVGQLLKNRYPKPEIRTSFGNAQAAFSSLVAPIETKSISPDEAFVKQTEIVVELMAEVIPHIMEASGLSYDPVASSHHLIIATNQNLPLLIEGMARLRVTGSMIFARGMVDTNDRANIKSLESFLESPQRDLLHNFRAAEKSGNNKDINALVETVSTIEAKVSRLLLLVDREISSKDITTYDPNTFFKESSAIINEMYSLGKLSNQVLSAMMQQRIDQANNILLVNLSMIGGLILLLVLVSTGVIRSLNKALYAVRQAIDSVSHGNFNIDLNKSRKDEFGVINNGLMSMSQSLATARAERERIQQEVEARLIETTRIEEALNATTTNVMIADNDRNIIYTNRSVQAMLSNAESELRKVLPHFTASEIVGSSMDIFHKDPSHQKRLLETLKSTYEANIQVGTLHFRLVANPIYSNTNERLGSIVEWQDRTAEVGAENEIANIVKEASRGNFSMRVKMEKKEGFMKFISESLNQLVETADYGLTDIGRVLMSLSQGNLTEKIVADYEGQFDDLKRYCNETSENLASMIGEIRMAAETINIASTEIAQGNVDLSNRTESQASSLQETASSMAQITSTVQLNADNANQANLLASEASEVALEGGRLIGQVVDTMASINQSSQKIADIIGVIDGIAFQTNILALNAAVEAARAGEQGRGFAVVASEVRTLAQRSANAAKDIKSLISDSVGKIEDGNQLVGQSGQTMDRIVESIKRVNGIMSSIASASAEQSSGVNEINKAISAMDEMTQQNAALVEQSAASAESMQAQASQLEERVSTFILSKVSSTPKATSPIESALSPSIGKTKATTNKASSAKPSAQTKAPQLPDSAKKDTTASPNTQSKGLSKEGGKAPSNVPKPATKVVQPPKKPSSQPPVLDDDDWEEF